MASSRSSSKVSSQVTTAQNHITGAQSSPIEPCPFSISTTNNANNERTTSMITLECNSSKKLGLPGYSSHQFSITLRTEIADLNQVQTESARLYKLLQDGVDTSIQQVGFLPAANGNGNGNGNGQRGGQGFSRAQPPDQDAWNCS